MIHLVNLDEHRILNDAGDRIPVGLLSMASYIQENGHNVNVYDLNHESPSRLITNLKSDERHIVGISVYTSPVYEEAIELAEQLKPYAKLVAGGHHATHVPESLTPHFDAVVRGWGEEGMMKALYSNGIIQGEMPDLSKTPTIDYGLLDMSKYGINQSDKRTGTIITSRGCFGNCAFCGKLENKVRTEPIHKIKTQIDDLKELGFKSIYFLDDIFTANKKRMRHIVEYTHSKNMPFRITTRADLLNSYDLEILKEQGCEWISIGVESGNDGVLKRCNKGMTTEQNKNIIIEATKNGINTKGFFIIGLPGETEETARDTINFIKDLKHEGMKQADVYYLTPFPGTPIWNNPEKFGIEILDKDYTQYLQAGKNARCVINTEGLKASRIEELVEEAREEWTKS